MQPVFKLIYIYWIYTFSLQLKMFCADEVFFVGFSDYKCACFFFENTNEFEIC